MIQLTARRIGHIEDDCEFGGCDKTAMFAISFISLDRTEYRLKGCRRETLDFSDYCITQGWRVRVQE